MTKRKPTKKAKPAISTVPVPKMEPPQSPKATIDLIPAVNWGRP